MFWSSLHLMMLMFVLIGSWSPNYFEIRLIYPHNATEGNDSIKPNVQCPIDMQRFMNGLKIQQRQLFLFGTEQGNGVFVSTYCPLLAGMRHLFWMMASPVACNILLWNHFCNSFIVRPRHLSGRGGGGIYSSQMRKEYDRSFVFSFGKKLKVLH